MNHHFLVQLKHYFHARCRWFCFTAAVLSFVILFSENAFSQQPLSLTKQYFSLSLPHSPDHTMHLSLRFKDIHQKETDLLILKQKLEAWGGALQSIIGSVVTITIPSSSVDSLNSLTPFNLITQTLPDEQLSMTISRGNDQVGGNWIGIQVDSVHQLGYTGKGVIVGVVDDGFDFNNSDFKDPFGKTRILYMWNQMTDTPVRFPTNPSYSYGTEWDSAAINLGLASLPNNSHGTNCLGIAAGDGSQSGEMGIAPEANIILVVRKTGAGASGANSIDAFNYIQKKAHNLGLPVSISYSIGGHNGAHDGSRDQEIAIDSLAGNGVLFSTAAGNDRSTGVYTNTVVSEGDSTEFRFTATSTSQFFVGNAWIKGSDSVSISLLSPTGERLSTVPSDSTTPVLTLSQGTFQLSNEIYIPNGDWNIQWGIRPTVGHTGNWRLQINGGRILSDGKIDAWRTSSISAGAWQHPINEKTIVTPSTADSAISVAAFQLSTGAIEPSSSMGLTRDNREKPELTAPTNVITTAGLFGGTSASAPHVAGVGALLLQANPHLSVNDFSKFLIESARKDPQTSVIPPFSTSWGNGKLHALGALESLNPFAPSWLSFQSFTSSSVLLSWAGNTTHFDLFQNGLQVYSGSGNSLPISGLMPLTPYTYTLRGKKPDGTALSPSRIEVGLSLPENGSSIRSFATTRTFKVGEGTNEFSIGETGAHVRFPAGVTAVTSFTAIKRAGIATVVGSLPEGITTLSQDGYWTIEASAGSSVGNYSLTLDLTGISGITNFSSLKLLKRENQKSSWQQVEELGVTLTYNDPFLTASGLTSFSDFVVASSGDNPLPVQVTNFSFSLEISTVRLSWSTISELNNRGFIIMRKTLSNIDPPDWIPIAGYHSFPELQGQGTTSEPHRYSFLDRGIEAHSVYRYKLRSIDADGTIHDYPHELQVETNGGTSGQPVNFSLQQNYPNPFNPSTTIEYSLATESNVRLDLYDVLGRNLSTIVKGRQPAGIYRVTFDPKTINLSSGVYFYTLIASQFSFTRKMVFMK